ncbi:VWA domain-containing protein [Planctomycetota bacterium]|nr:VWA domain-containing protein [Planctomycetota bacterium]
MTNSEEDNPVINSVPITNKLLLSLIVDYSGSLADEGDAASIEEFVKRIRQELPGICDGFQIPCKIRCLAYSDEPRWVQEEFVNLESFEFELPSGGKFSNFGAALREILNKNLLSNDQRKEVWLWVSDGFPTDSWLEAAELLRTNAAFEKVERYSVHPEGDTRYESLLWFAGNENRVMNSTEVDSGLFTEFAMHCLPEQSSDDPWDDPTF